MDDTLTFAQPAWIWIGLAVCVALVFGALSWNRRRERDLRKIVHARLLKQLTESVSRRRRHIKQGLWIAGVFCVFLALARPQYGFEFREVKRRGIDLVFAVDTSRSMLAEDVLPNRLERARLAITDFVQKLEGDRVALIPFAGNAFSLCPLTLDYSAFFQSLDALDTGIIPHQGTDLASAVREANRLFDEEGNNHRILILITDGEDLQGAVMEAIETAKEKGMTIHTVGVGDPTGALIPITNPDGSQDFVRDDAGQPVRTALDAETLQEIAGATGGIHAPLGAAGQGLETIYQEKLRLVPKSELNQRLDRIPLERYEWPLAAGIVLLLLEFLLGDRRRVRQRKPRVVSVARRKRAAAALLVIGLLPKAVFAEAETDPRSIYNTGTEAYRSGDFATAEEVLADGLGATDDLSLQQRSYYNLGNARYRLGEQTAGENPEATIQKWEAAVKSFEDAMALNPEDEDAKFNRDFVKEKLEELKQQQEEQQDQKQQEQSQDEQQSEGEQENDEQQESEGGEEESEPQDSEDSSERKDGEHEEELSGEQGSENQKSGSEGEEQEPEKEQAGSEGQEEEKSEEQPSEGSGEESSEEQPEQSGEEQQPAEPSEEDNESEQPESTEPRPGEQGEQQPEPQPTDPAENGQPMPDQPDESERQKAPASFSEERRQPGEMSKEEAAQLLEALESDEESVIPLPDARAYRSVVPNNTTRGKTW